MRADSTGLIARALLVGLATVPAWFFGGIEPSHQVWLFVAASIAAACWLIHQASAARSPHCFPLAAAPLALGIVWTLLQLAPLSPHWRQTLSPVGERWRATAPAPQAQVAPEKGAGAPADSRSAMELEGARSPLSLHPASSRRDLALLLLATAMFLVGAGLFDTRRAFFWLCAAVAANGAALAFFGLVQKLTWSGQLYWQTPLAEGGSPFASYVNRNHAAGYLNLCLAGAIGVCLWAGARRSQDAADGPQASVSLGRERAFHKRLAAALASLDATLLSGLALAAMIIAGVLASLSRGGWVAMLGAAAMVSASALIAQRRVAVWGRFALAGAAGLALIGWLGWSGLIQGRAATLLDGRLLSGGRLAHWRDGAAAASDFWLTGSGAGTYRYIYRPYERHTSGVWFYHAENQYLEAAVEGGLPGLMLLVLTLALAGIAALWLLREPHQARSWAVGAAAAFALASQAIQATVDFGLYLPANMLLLAILSGAACGLAARRVGARPARRLIVAPGARGVSLAAGAALCLGLVFGLVETRRAAAVEAALAAANWDAAPHRTPAAAIEAAIARLEEALAERPQDAEGQRRLADLHVHLFRLRLLDPLRAQSGSPPLSDADLWPITSPTLIAARMQQIQADSAAEGLQAWRDDRAAQAPLAQAAERLALARRACPLLADVEVTLAELSVILFAEKREEGHLARAAALAPADAAVLFRCGWLEMAAGRPQRAAARWRRCLELEPALLKRVMELAAPRFALDELVDRVLPASPWLLLDLAQSASASAEQANERNLLIDRAESLLPVADMPAAERAYVQGQAHELRGSLPAAAAAYQKAVELRPHAVDWRGQLARVYQRQGQLAEAREQARWCVRMAPDDAKSLALLQELHREELRQITTTAAAGALME